MQPFTVRDLVRSGVEFRDLEVTGARIEEAFMALTSGEPLRLPGWSELPAMRRFAISTASVLRAVSGFNSARPEAGRLRPGGFLRVPHVLEAPAGVDPHSFRLIGPFERDPQRWRKGPWLNVHPTRRRDVDDLWLRAGRAAEAEEARADWASLRDRVLAVGRGIRPDRDYPAGVIPAPLRRRSGLPLDDIARHLGGEFDLASADELLVRLQAGWAAARAAEGRRVAGPDWEVRPPGETFLI
jgi:hypothetical protein